MIKALRNDLFAVPALDGDLAQIDAVAVFEGHVHPGFDRGDAGFFVDGDAEHAAAVEGLDIAQKLLFVLAVQSLADTKASSS